MDDLGEPKSDQLNAPLGSDEPDGFWSYNITKPDTDFKKLSQGIAKLSGQDKMKVFVENTVNDTLLGIIKSEYKLAMGKSISSSEENLFPKFIKAEDFDRLFATIKSGCSEVEWCRFKDTARELMSEQNLEWQRKKSEMALFAGHDNKNAGNRNVGPQNEFAAWSSISMKMQNKVALIEKRMTENPDLF